MLKHGWRRRVLPFVATLVFLGVLPSVGGAVVNIEWSTHEALPDYDARATVDPSADQLAAARSLGASVQWNQFGAPSSVIRYGGALASGISAPDAVAAAKSFLAANSTLFKLGSVDSLEVA